MRTLWSRWRFYLALLLLGIMVGLSGIVLHLILDETKALSRMFGKESMTIGHGLLLILSGFVAGLSWYRLQSPPSVLYRVRELVFDTELRQLRYGGQVWHVLLQVITVGLGSPIGKEAAPRELGALLARPLGKSLHLSSSDSHFLTAAGVGAGLAAVYQVPLASVFFVFETLRLDYSFKRFGELSLVTYVSAWTASMVISSTPLFPVRQVELSWRSLFGSIVITLVLFPFAMGVKHFIRIVETNKNKSASMIWLLPVIFLLLAVVSITYPQLMGNGSEMAITFLKQPTSHTVAVLLVLKVMFVLATLKAGAYGGTLTPSFALGMGLAYLVAVPFHFSSGFLFMVMTTGTLVFLAINLRAPLAAFFIVVGFTGISPQVYPYLLVSLLMVLLLEHYTEKYLVRRKALKTTEYHG